MPDGRTLPKPGNLFGVTESTLWSTNDAFKVNDLGVDFNGDGTPGFGDSVPDANVLKGAADLLDRKTGELEQAAIAWQPTEAEAFGALVANVPTVSDFMDSWKNSRFVQTDPDKRSSDFVAISRLSDIVDNITSWQTIYAGLSPLVVAVDRSAMIKFNKGCATSKAISQISTLKNGGICRRTRGDLDGAARRELP